MRVGKILEKVIITPETKLNTVDLVIIDYIKQHGFISDKDYAKITPRAKATRTLDFKRLTELKIIVRAGLGKNTYYKLI